MMRGWTPGECNSPDRRSRIAYRTARRTRHAQTPHGQITGPAGCPPPDLRGESRLASRIPLQPGLRLLGTVAVPPVRRQQRRGPLPGQQLRRQHPRVRAGGRSQLRRPHGTAPGPGLGLRHVGRHRGEHVRPLHGPGAIPRRHRLLLPGHPLQHPQAPSGP